MRATRNTLLVVLVMLMPFAGWGASAGNDNTTITTSHSTATDPGEKTAADYRAQHSECTTVIEYGKQPQSVGRVTGDAEKDTMAYPVERSRTDCP